MKNALKKLSLTLFVTLFIFSQNGFAAGHIQSTGEKLSDFPPETIVQEISKTYFNSGVGKITAKVLLVPSLNDSRVLRAILSLNSTDRNEIFTLQENATDLIALNISKGTSKVLEIDIKKGNTKIEMNILPLVERINGPKHDIYNQVVHFSEYGYRR